MPSTEMRPAPLEVGEIFRRYGPAFLEAWGDVISFEQRQVLEAVSMCRTPALGGHLYECDSCGHPLVLYNSCLNRHCPLCQADEAAEWFDSRLAEVLPVGYFHIVFTLPRSFALLALQNKRVVYDLLFRAASRTLLEIAADPKHLGAKIGFLAILHTWGQSLLDHPHIHCVVPGGGLSPDRSRWVTSRSDFFLPVKVLSHLFRGKLLALLEEAFNKGRLSFHGSIASLANMKEFHKLINTARKKEWVVYAKEPHGSPQQVLKYLARYTHRVALSNNRLISIDGGRVTFRSKDYEHGGRWRKITLQATEFIRRFLLHVLPKGFVRIRSYGFLANRGRSAHLDLCRRLLGASPASVDPLAQEASAVESDDHQESDDEETACKTSLLCPACRKGHLVCVREIAPTTPTLASAVPSRTVNTS
jgi:hypothetical protein